ncbi:PorV/PorQ family protein [Porphyromonas sp.]
MTIHTKHLLLGALLGLSCLPLTAQKVKQVRTLPLLELSTDARSAALGGSHYGEASSSLLYTNPTNLLYSPSQLQASASARLMGKLEGTDGSLQLYQATAGLRLGERHGLFAGFRYLGGLQYEAVNDQEQSKGSFSPYDYSLDLGYALRLGRLSAYATAGYVQSQLGERTANTVLLGLGAYYRSHAEEPSQGLSYLVGAKAQNMSLGFKYAKHERRELYAPVFVGAGGELRYGLSQEHRLGLSAGADVFTYPVNSSSVALHFGGEYSFRRMLAARVGYQHDTNGLQGFTLGLGYHGRRFQLDGAYLAPSTSGTNSSLLFTAGISL